MFPVSQEEAEDVVVRSGDADPSRVVPYIDGGSEQNVPCQANNDGSIILSVNMSWVKDYYEKSLLIFNTPDGKSVGRTSRMI